MASIGVAVFCLVSTFSIVSNQLHMRQFYDVRLDTNTYDPALGGLVRTTEVQSLNEAQARMGDGTLFSTYAGALEYRMGTFQPTGYDYIIHALGDDARAHYVDTFINGGYDFVSTMRNHYPFEPWVENANWFFYRELYDRYVPSFFNNEQIFWEKAPQPMGWDVPIEIVVTQESPRQVRIEAFSEDETLTGTVDLAVRFHTRPTAGVFELFQMNRSVMVGSNVLADVSSRPERTSYHLPAETDTAIPLPMRNGYGKLLLSTNPASDELTVESASMLRFFATPFNFVVASAVEENRLTLPATREYTTLLEGAIALRSASGEEVAILGVEESADRILVAVEPIADVAAFSNQNAITLVRG